MWRDLHVAKLWPSGCSKVKNDALGPNVRLSPLLVRTSARCRRSCTPQIHPLLRMRTSQGRADAPSVARPRLNTTVDKGGERRGGRAEAEGASLDRKGVLGCGVEVQGRLMTSVALPSGWRVRSNGLNVTNRVRETQLGAGRFEDRSYE